jgi:hypothetical protein
MPSASLEQIPQWRSPNFGSRTIFVAMTTMNISLPDALKSFVDEQSRRVATARAASMSAN